MSALFSPLVLREVTLRNRIVFSPMCQYSSEDGFAADWHLVHLGSRAIGGAGLVFTEAIAVEARGRISPLDLGIWKDEHIEMLARIARFIAQHGGVAATQLAHAGRKASIGPPWDRRGRIEIEDGGWTPVAPSAIAVADNYALPHALSGIEIESVIAEFGAAARRSLDAGFTVTEIHAAHGYLIHEFLSPLGNLRDDEYGGSFDNRIRLLLRIVDAVREEWPERYPLFVRISATDWSEGGWTIEESVELAKILAPRGVDVIDTTSGGIIRFPTSEPAYQPLYQVSLARRIRDESGVPTVAVGGITTALEAESIVADGSADLVAIARRIMGDPYFPARAALELSDPLTLPLPYQRALL